MLQFHERKNQEYTWFIERDENRAKKLYLLQEVFLELPESACICRGMNQFDKNKLWEYRVAARR